MNGTTIITGANSSYFLMACLLMESVRKFAGQCRFLVLDFGLSESERRFLQRSDSLLDMPKNVAGVSSASHPYFLKTAAIGYLAAVPDSSPIVWMDSDLVIGGDLDDALGRVLEGMAETQSTVAACRESAVQDVFALRNLDLGPFKELLDSCEIPASAPYYNTGFVIVRSREFLREWFELASRTPFHALFDQNIFNVMIHTRYKIAPLPQEDWNLHGSLLAAEALAKTLRSHALPKILHATSSEANHLELVSLSLRKDFGRDYPLRFFENPILRKHQFSLLTDFIGREFPESDGAAMSFGNRAHLKISRNAPCPCDSGEKYKSCHGKLA